MLSLIAKKFAHPDLWRCLQATADRPLFELNTWGDRTWGVVESHGNLLGANGLGQALMQIRAGVVPNTPWFEPARSTAHEQSARYGF